MPFAREKLAVSPYTNRFLSADTVVPNPSDPQAFNRYSYVLGNPLLYVDPSGHASVCGFSYSDPDCPPVTSPVTKITTTAKNLKAGSSGSGGSPSPTPTSTTTPSPSSTPCPSVVLIECSFPSSMPTPYPPLTGTPPTYNVGTCQDTQTCLGPLPPSSTPWPTSTPFGQNYLPAVGRAVNIVNPFVPSYEPDFATWFWDTVLSAAPILGLPASNLNQVVTTAVTTTTNAVRFVATTSFNAALSVGETIGNVTNNIAGAVSSMFETGLGITLPIFILPSDEYLFPTSPPTGSA